MVGALFLLIGGVLALEVVRIANIYTWSLEDETKLVQPNARKARILWNIEMNQKSTLLKTNKAEASYACIRNGVVMLAFAAAAFALMRAAF